MDETRSTPSSLFERVPPAAAVAWAVGLLLVNSLVQALLAAWISDAVSAIALGSLLCFVALPALLWRRVGAATDAATLSMREDLGSDALRPAEVGWLLVLTAAMLLPLDLLGEWNQWVLPAPDSYAELQAKLLPSGPFETVRAYLGLGILVPVGEEIVFRGIVQQAIRRSVGPWSASVLAGSLFALLHLEPWFLLPLAVTGTLLGIVYEITDTLWAPVLLHVLYNCAVLSLWIFTASDEIPGAPVWRWSLSVLGVAAAAYAISRLGEAAEPVSTSSKD
jgi:membrane protease YdiL (CAAX protease family)